MDPANSAGAGGASAGGSPASKAGSSSTAGAIGDDSSPSGDAGDMSGSSTAGAPSASSLAFCGVAYTDGPAPTFATPEVVSTRLKEFLTGGKGDSPTLPQVTTRQWAGDLAMSMLGALGNDSAPGMVSFVSDRLLPGSPIAPTWAAFFSVKGATLTDLLTTNLVRNPGSGVLTDTAVLYQAGIQRVSISARGQYVRKHLLCSEVPPPPPGIPALPDAMPGQTRRELLDQSAVSPTCRSCHALMDPIGEALDHFDTVGAYSNVDNGSAIDSTGSLTLTSGTFTFDGANQLGAKLADQCEVAQCLAQQMLDHAEASAALPPAANPQGRDAADPSKVAPIAAAFSASKGDLRTLIREVVQSDTFLRAP